VVHIFSVIGLCRRKKNKIYVRDGEYLKFFSPVYYNEGILLFKQGESRTYCFVTLHFQYIMYGACIARGDELRECFE